MKHICILASPVILAGFALAQVPNPTQSLPQSETPQAGRPSGPMPIYKVTVVQRTTQAINYRHRSGETKVDFRGTELLPQAHGDAEVKSQNGYTDVDAHFEDVDPASRFGPEYLTYVLWAVTPEGRATNLGEVLTGGNRKGKLHVTSELQAFGLIVTAEPYFAVTQPSDVVVMENIVRHDTEGRIETIDAKYELLKRGQYTLNSVGPVNPAIHDKQAPLELREARNAMQIATWTGANKYAPDMLRKAQIILGNAEAFARRKSNSKDVISLARQVVQTAEDARIVSIRRQDEERLAQERQAAADREARAKAEAEKASQQQQLEAERRARAEAERAKAEQERIAAEQAKAEADAAARQAAAERAAAERARAEAEAARQAALTEQAKLQTQAQLAQQQAEQADRLRQKAEADRDNLREQLRQQLNTVLETRETARGLIVNMSDVLFDTARYTLRQGAREKLARVAGIVEAHPGLSLEVEGHTDSIGGDEYNQKLSEQRANSVRDFLVSQGVRPDTITARGFGKTQPVASNDTAAGRQMNRRVELVVSGDIIGRQHDGSVTSSQPAPPPQP